MPDQRPVHDILSDHRRPLRMVSFIQWGDKETGNVYENICPWCGLTIGWVRKIPTIGGLYRALMKTMKVHWPLCKAHNTVKFFHVDKLAVTLTTKALNTQRLPDDVFFGDLHEVETENERSH